MYMYVWMGTVLLVTLAAKNYVGRIVMDLAGKCTTLVTCLTPRLNLCDFLLYCSGVRAGKNPFVCEYRIDGTVARGLIDKILNPLVLISLCFLFYGYSIKIITPKFYQHSQFDTCV
jgi:hypothetical protein